MQPSFLAAARMRVEVVGCIIKNFRIGRNFMKTILVDAVDCFVIEGRGIFKEMQHLLETFKNRKIILTGAKKEKFKELGLDKIPYEVFTLEHKPEKTDPKYYKIMLRHFGFGKEDVIYFEHNPDAIKAAKTVGIVSYYYDANKRDLEALRKFLEKNI